MHVDLEMGEEHQGSAAVLAVINVVVHASEGVAYRFQKSKHICNVSTDDT